MVNGGCQLLLPSQELCSEEWKHKFHHNNVHHVMEGNKVIWHFFCKQLPFWVSNMDVKEMSREKKLCTYVMAKYTNNQHI
jgi:hypothetical protein